MSKLKYKVGDRVKIKSLDWYNKNKDSNGNVVVLYRVPHFSWYENVLTVFTKDMVKFCGKVVTIESVFTVNYSIVEGTDRDYFTDEMIECKMEEETKIESKFKVGDILFYRGETSGYLKVEEIREENGEIRYYETSRNLYLVENDPDVFFDKVCSVETEKTKNNNDMEEKETLLGWVKESDNLRLVPHKDYEIKHDGDNFYLVKKKKEYPKTYEECCKVLGVDPDNYLTIRNVHCYDGEEEIVNYERDLLGKFKSLWELLICRDAYWKLYGEEMGLGEPWEYDCKSDYFAFAIIYRNGWIQKVGIQHKNAILAFPTEEIRDAFYENFKEEIEICKELL